MALDESDLHPDHVVQLHELRQRPGTKGSGTPKLAEAKLGPDPLLLWPHDFAEPKPPRFIAGLLDHGDDALIFGPYEAGKTFCMIDLAARGAAGMPWHGRELQRGIYVYLAGERQLSVQRRARGWMMRHDVRSSAAAPFPLPVLNGGLDLFGNDSDLDRLIAAMKAARDQAATPIAGIVADTIHSLTPGSDETNGHFGTLLHRLRRVRDELAQGQDFPPTNLLTHHSPRADDSNPRGGTALPAAVGLAIGIRPDGPIRHLVIHKGSDFVKDDIQLAPAVIDTVTLKQATGGEPAIQTGVWWPAAEGDLVKNADLRARAQAMKKEGKSQREIAAALIINQSTVCRWLAEK